MEASRGHAGDPGPIRLAVRPDESTLLVVGTKGGKLAFFDELNPTKLRILGAGARMLALLAIVKEDPGGMLRRLRDTEYARLVSPDPTRLGRVQVSGPLARIIHRSPENGLGPARPL
jgi:hypothetical protein